jgi:hypothetical protein
MSLQDTPLYLLTIALLGEAVYLHSPIIAVSAVVLWGIQVAQTVLTRKNRDADITELMDTMRSHKAKMDILTRDITNVAERARTILGENF